MVNAGYNLQDFSPKYYHVNNFLLYFVIFVNSFVNNRINLIVLLYIRS
jgi:hypothetical protein